MQSPLYQGPDGELDAAGSYSVSWKRKGYAFENE
jgi:hypothetical protein